MNSPHKKAATRSRGMTLIESVIVILVMIAVIAVVFMGTRSWKKSSDRTACINNIKSVQHAVRAYQNLHGLPAQTPIRIRMELIGPNLHLTNEPQCPSYGHYDYVDLIPPSGQLAVTCSLPKEYFHYPPSDLGW